MRVGRGRGGSCRKIRACARFACYIIFPFSVSAPIVIKTLTSLKNIKYTTDGNMAALWVTAALLSLLGASASAAGLDTARCKYYIHTHMTDCAM